MRGLLVFGGILLATPAFGYSAAPPHSFAKPTANGKYVLVMLQKWDRPAEPLSKKYALSGLYPKDDPANPVWTCDWSANWERNVFASNDGVFVVRVPDSEPGLRSWLLQHDRPVPPKRAGWENEPAVMIYKNGQLFRTIALRDVFRCSRFTDRECFMGPIVTIDSFHDDGGRVSISTHADGKKQTVTVAFRTGEAIESGGGSSVESTGSGGSFDSSTATGRNWGRTILIGLLVVGVGAAGLVGLVLLARKQPMRNA
ncbi:MAG: hypothetical protein L0241_20790 [Planctomycetia bacterium]|nr:hypothetical protein [Planctomycetia bacterium]